ncbi:MAG: T9SS type A sorting domain-containing protein [Candidatus Eisenbacteria bacterium]|nr:T9SS type A sorting domain-containing protein [Candidatus Eisenbacteria bacterium]
MLASRHFTPLALASSLLASLVPSNARAEWLPNGTPVATVTGVQMSTQAASDGAGGAFVAWTDGRWVQVQRLTSTGSYAAEWPAVGRVVSTGHYRDKDIYPVLAPDGDGGVYVVWYMSGENCVAHCSKEPARLWVQRFTAAGTIAPGWPPEGVPVQDLSPGWPPYSPSVSPDGDHGVLITWRDSRGVTAQWIDPDGTRRWGSDGLVICAVQELWSQPAIVSDGLGGAFVFWGDHRSTGPCSRIYGQHVSDRGTPTWAPDGIPISEFPVLVYGFYEGPPVAVPDGARGAIVAWAGSRDAVSGIFAARVTRGGGLPWQGDVPLSTAPGGKDWFRMVPLPGGGAIVAWLDGRRLRLGDVYAQRITHGGSVAWAPNGVPVCTAPGSRGPFALAGDGSDGAYLAWGDNRPEAELYAMHLTGEGTIARGWPLDGAPVSQRVPLLDPNYYSFGALALTAVSGGQAILAWQDVRPAPNGFIDIEESFAMLLTPGGPATPPGIPRIVKLPARPGAQTGPAAHPGFALLGAQPNPASGAPVVHLSLPDAAPATLELMDVAGRRIWTREVGDLGTGDHDVRLGDGTWLPPAVYLVRLTQGGRAATARIAIVR